jgi:hypothetical protein
VEYAGKDKRIPDGEQRYILIYFRHRLDELRFDEEWVLRLIDSHRANVIHEAVPALDQRTQQ